ncbi:O-demethylpuromycin-O-methyltransferase [Drechslerella dactyloides]|uniref:O-demethylpuromycin-O-methyltransferase n=1 Tax=Drechslerella dactyloides TaxID=74499 RepID=A0AAD6IVS0_DREDA|nr:O-demethylpuromycin-O-methyltransferase [Drechslerella dactyloides]
MGSTTPTDQAALQLLELGGLIQTAIADFVAANSSKVDNVDGPLPSHALFEAKKVLLSAAGMITELVSDPSLRVIEVALQHYESRSMHIAASLRIPDILAEHGDTGCDIKDLAARVGIEARKLSRVMRCLCSIHVFRETAEDVFANNAISAALVGNDPLRAYILLCGQYAYTASDYLPRILTDPVKGPSYSVDVTAFQDAVGTKKSIWDWMEETTTARDILDGRNGPDGAQSAYPGIFGNELQEYMKKTDDGEDDRKRVPRPEHDIFSLAMIGGGRVSGIAHLYDFPWASLGSATVVDVGGGMGGFSLGLSHLYPDLNFVIQDRGKTLSKGEAEVWPRENPSALQQGRVKFIEHDFFEENPVKGADIYWLRYILHDWGDDYCVRILKGIKGAMGPRSRLLICDQVMNTTCGDPQLPRAPSVLPANYGYFTRYSHVRDLELMAFMNGIERKPTEFRSLVEKAGLHLNKFWETRSQVGLVEVVLKDSELCHS